MLRGGCHANPVRKRVAGQENTRGIFTKLQREHTGNILKNKINTSKRNKRVKHTKQIPERVLIVLVTRNRMAKPVSRDQILRREWRQKKVYFPCSAADHEQDLAITIPVRSILC